MAILLGAPARLVYMGLYTAAFGVVGLWAIRIVHTSIKLKVTLDASPLYSLLYMCWATNAIYWTATGR